MKNLKKIFLIAKIVLQKKIVRIVIIPVSLLMFWIFSTFIYGSYKNFSVLEYSHVQDAPNNSGGKILKDQKIIFKFNAKKNNLGIVAVKLENVPRVDFNNEDTLVFRIKEVNSKDWQYINKYRSGQMSSKMYFPFGFLEIQDSIGKDFIFEIKSLNGNEVNAITLKDENVRFISKYKYSKSQIFTNNQSALSFLKDKAFTVFTSKYILISSSIFLLPFIFYILFLILGNESKASKIFKKNKYVYKIINRFFIKCYKIKRYLFLGLCLFFIFLYIFTTEVFVSGFVIGLLGFWVISIRINKISSRVTYFLSFIIVCISVVNIYFNFGLSSDEVSSFAYMLLLLGLLQDLLGFRLSSKIKN